MLPYKSLAKIYIDLSDKYELSIAEVKEICDSQFNFCKHIMMSADKHKFSTFKAIYLMKLGTFTPCSKRYFKVFKYLTDPEYEYRCVKLDIPEHPASLKYPKYITKPIGLLLTKYGFEIGTYIYNHSQDKKNIYYPIKILAYEEIHKDSHRYLIEPVTVPLPTKLFKRNNRFKRIPAERLEEILKREICLEIQ